MEPIPISSPIPISKDLKKRTRGEFESDCESVGDNFKCFFKHEIDQKMNSHASTSAHLPIAFTFCWTDDWLELLIDHYYAYLVGNNSREYCLKKLKQVLNVKSIELDDNCHEIEVNDDDISSKLTELAEIVKSKSEGVGWLRYGELKEILGKDKCNKLKNVVRHTKFEFYSPPTYVEESVYHIKKRFYWTDSRLRLLVTSYHSYLEKIHKVTRQGGCRKDCLTFIKKSFDNVSFDELTRKINGIFQHQRSGGEWRAHLRLRLGKETCIIFDQLLRNACHMHEKPEKPSVTSPSRGSSSRSFISSGSRSTYRSVSMQDQGDQAEATKLITELKKFEFDNTDFISAYCVLMDDKNRNYFWA